MLLTLIGQELSGGQRQARSDDAFNPKHGNESIIALKLLNIQLVRKLKIVHHFYKMVRKCLRRIIGQIQEQTHVVHGAVLLEVRLEKPCRLHVHLKAEGFSPITL